MTLETAALIFLTPFVTAGLAVIIPIGIYDWRHYEPNDWGR